MSLSTGISSLTRVEAIFRNPVLYELAALIPEPPKCSGGAPRKYPPFMWLAFGPLMSVWGSARQVEAELAHPSNWTFISDLVRSLHPTQPEMWLPPAPMRRYHFTYGRNQYLCDAQLKAPLGELYRERAVTQAEDNGLLDARSGGSWSHPHPTRIIAGDGKVITPASKYKPGSTYTDPQTGVTRLRRAEKDARDHFEGGERETTRGTKCVMLTVRDTNEHSRMLLDFETVPGAGGEAKIAVDCVRRVASIAQDAQGVVYDMAFRGKHNQQVLQMGLIPIGKVVPESAGNRKINIPRKPKSKHIEDRDVTLADGTTKRCRIYAEDGAIRLAEFDARGKQVFIPLEKVDVDRKSRRNGFRWYVTYRIPPIFGGGGSLLIRADQTRQDEVTGLNRTENVRIIPPPDPEFGQLFGLRQDTESNNRALEDTLYLRRAHSYGNTRQWVDLLGYGLMLNSLAVHLASRQRTSQAESA
jgi:hypothetical protein